jgi:hypothetical protein
MMKKPIAFQLLVWCRGGRSRAAHHGGSIWWGKTAHLMVGKQETEEVKGTLVPESPSRAHSQRSEVFPLGPTS